MCRCQTEVWHAPRGRPSELAAALRGPAVLKAVGERILHKTEAQLVVLGLRTRDQVAAAYAALERRAGGALEAVLVEEMVAGQREFLVGMKRDAAFGTVVAFGLGGVMTEVLGDIALAVAAPLDERDAAELLGLIRAEHVLGAFRGQPAVDRGKVADVVRAVARIAAAHPQIAEIDINPLLIAGSSPVAADALMVLSREHREPRPRRTFTPICRRCSSRARWP